MGGKCTAGHCGHPMVMTGFNGHCIKNGCPNSKQACPVHREQK